MDRTRTVMYGDCALPPELVTREAASLRALARSLALDEHAADDVVQETWLRALTSPPAERERIGGWLRRVVEGFASKRRRSEARRVHRERLYARERPESTTDARSRAETLRSVVDAVLSLDEPYRETVLQRWFEGLPPRDIAVRQKTTVATVNSRLQRAHALLRARLARKLDVDERELRGALLALFGFEGVRTIGAAASLSILGVLLTTTKMIAGAAVAALVLCAFLYFDRGAGDRDAQLVSKPDAQPAEFERGQIDAIAADESKRIGLGAVAAGSAATASESSIAGPYAYDVTVVVLDETGRPRPRVNVWMGPDLERTADFGSTGWNGELSVKWRCFQASHDFILELRGSGLAANPLRRIQFDAGSPERLVVMADSDGSQPVLADMFISEGRMRSATLDQRAAIESIDNVRSFGFGLTVGEPTFGVDAAGNGIITDPWLMNRVTPPEMIGARFARNLTLETATHFDSSDVIAGTILSRLRMSGIEVVEHAVEPTRTLRGTLVDENSLPIADALVTLLAEAAGRRLDVRTDAEGAFDFKDLPQGGALLFAGGGAHTLVREEIADLAAEGFGSVRVVCATLLRTPLKLVDVDGKPLAKWRIEARRCDRHETFVDCVQLDDGGVGLLALPTTEIVRLYASQPERDGTPPMLLDRAFLGSARENVLTLRDDLRSASYAIDVHARAASDHGSIVMRLWRVDSAMGMSAAMVDVQALESGDTNRSLFRGKGLFPGDYTIEYGARGSPWKQLGPFRFAPGAEFTLAPLMLEDPARVRVSATTPESKLTFQARTRRQGLLVQSPPIRGDLPATLLFTAGEYELSVKRDEKEAATRTLNVASGTESAIELEVPH